MNMFALKLISRPDIEQRHLEARLILGATSSKACVKRSAQGETSSCAAPPTISMSSVPRGTSYPRITPLVTLMQSRGVSASQRRALQQPCRPGGGVRHCGQKRHPCNGGLDEGQPGDLQGALCGSGDARPQHAVEEDASYSCYFPAVSCAVMSVYLHRRTKSPDTSKAFAILEV